MWSSVTLTGRLQEYGTFAARHTGGYGGPGVGDELPDGSTVKGRGGGGGGGGGKAPKGQKIGTLTLNNIMGWVRRNMPQTYKSLARAWGVSPNTIRGTLAVSKAIKSGNFYNSAWNVSNPIRAAHNRLERKARAASVKKGLVSRDVQELYDAAKNLRSKLISDALVTVNKADRRKIDRLIGKLFDLTESLEKGRGYKKTSWRISGRNIQIKDGNGRWVTIDRVRSGNAGGGRITAILNRYIKGGYIWAKVRYRGSDGRSKTMNLRGAKATRRNMVKYGMRRYATTPREEAEQAIRRMRNWPRRKLQRELGWQRANRGKKGTRTRYTRDRVIAWLIKQLGGKGSQGRTGKQDRDRARKIANAYIKSKKRGHLQRGIRLWTRRKRMKGNRFSHADEVLALLRAELRRRKRK